MDTLTRYFGFLLACGKPWKLLLSLHNIRQLIWSLRSMWVFFLFLSDTFYIASLFSCRQSHSDCVYHRIQSGFSGFPHNRNEILIGKDSFHRVGDEPATPRRNWCHLAASIPRQSSDIIVDLITRNANESICWVAIPWNLLQLNLQPIEFDELDEIKFSGLIPSSGPVIYDLIFSPVFHCSAKRKRRGNNSDG